MSSSTERKAGNSVPDHNVDFKDQPAGRLSISLLIAVIVLFTVMVFFLRSEFKPPVTLPPLMELDYVTIEQPKEAPPPPKVIPKQAVQTKQEEKPQPVPQEPVPSEAALETSTEVPTPADIPAAPQKQEGTVAQVQQTVRIQSVAELDNTDFAPIFNPKPQYPKLALDAQIQGYVDVDLVINENGTMESFTITNISGHSSFGSETSKVLPRWRFPPPRIGGKKVKVTYNYRVNFKLN